MSLPQIDHAVAAVTRPAKPRKRFCEVEGDDEFCEMGTWVAME